MTEHLPKGSEDQQVGHDLAAALGKLNLVPSDTVSDIHHYGYAEDGRIVLWCTTIDGDDLVVSATPGKPLSVAVIDAASGMVRT